MAPDRSLVNQDARARLSVPRGRLALFVSVGQIGYSVDRVSLKLRTLPGFRTNGQHYRVKS